MKKLLLILIFVKMVFAFEAPPFPSYSLLLPSSNTSTNLEGNLMSLNKGWTMFGFDRGINDLNQTFMLHSDAISILWTYDDKTDSWLAFSPDENTTSILQNTPSVSLTNIIEPNQGFWVLAAMDKNITLDPNLGIPDEIIFVAVEPEKFESTGGTFKIDISPLDDNQELISENLTKDNFTFSNARLFDDSDNEVATATIVPTNVSITTATTQVNMNNIIIDIDSSGSMSNNDPNRLRVDAAKQLINLLAFNDIMATMDFGAGSDNSLLDSRLLQNFTNDQNALKNSIDLVTDSGGTPLYQSILDAVSLFDSIKYGTKTLILFTDGEAGDTSLKTSALTNAKDSFVTIHTIGLGSGVNAADLKDIASQTGGLYGLATDATELNTIFKAIGTGAIKGKVTITGDGTFTSNIAAGKYTLKSLLTTTVYGKSIVTSFEMPIVIE